MNMQQYKNLKGLKKQNLRDNMSTTELILNSLNKMARIRVTEQFDTEGLRKPVILRNI